MTTRDLICIACPLGCALHVELGENGAVLHVTGNSCKRGESYAKTECTNPTRSFTSTVRVEGGGAPLVSVKSAKPIPKGKMLACAAATKAVVIQAPVAIGDVVLTNAAGTGIDLVATNRVGKGG
ncbi:MAG: DUF1667 domain-containing protein [Oscillospiraceae bacterium]|jgi:CxxC motif-containing protein|nr:DUF1667 domain-containing protein [Oscillospiraceae bacterium]